MIRSRICAFSVYKKRNRLFCSLKKKFWSEIIISVIKIAWFFTNCNWFKFVCRWLLLLFLKLVVAAAFIQNIRFCAICWRQRAFLTVFLNMLEYFHSLDFLMKWNRKHWRGIMILSANKLNHWKCHNYHLTVTFSNNFS